LIFKIKERKVNTRRRKKLDRWRSNFRPKKRNHGRNINELKGRSYGE